MSVNLQTLSGYAANCLLATNSGNTAMLWYPFNTNVPAFLATPSSANLRTLMTDETGAGALVFGTSPGFTTAANPISSDGATLGTSSLMWSDLFLASGAVINFNNGNATVTHSAGLLTSNVDIAVPDEAYGAGWNGSLELPTKNAVYDKIETLGGASSPLVLTANSASEVPLTSKGAASQTGNLTNWKNSADTIVLNVDSAGDIRIRHTGKIYGSGGGQSMIVGDYSLTLAGSTNVDISDGTTSYFVKNNRNVFEIKNAVVTEANYPFLHITGTWNAGGVIHQGIKVNVTNTASATDSRLLDLGIGGTSLFRKTKEAWSIQAESGSNPTTAELTAGDHFACYRKADKLIFAYNNGGTMNYLVATLDGSTTTFTNSTTAP